MADADDHRRLYQQYDRRVDLVSIAQVWFTRAEDLSQTVAHFERFPRLTHPDGNPATPDFTVLFTDGTGLVGELSHIAPRTGALDSLVSQIRRYDTLAELPAAPACRHRRQPNHEVTAVDVVVFAPVTGINAAVDGIAELLADEDHPYKPQHPPMLLGYSYDADSGSYTFQRPARGRNELIRDHGRRASMTQWLVSNHDELRGLPKHFQSIKASARFMNDDPRELYLGTILWNVVLPDLARDRGVELPANLDVTEEELVERLRAGYGYAAKTDLLRKALEFLKIGRLCELTARGWRIYYRDLGRIEKDIPEALLHEHFSQANKKRAIRPARDVGRPASAARGADEQAALAKDNDTHEVEAAAEAGVPRNEAAEAGGPPLFIDEDTSEDL